MLTDMLVTNPAKINVRPNAERSAKRWARVVALVPGVVCNVSIGDCEAHPLAYSSAPDDVDHRENDHPDGVYKMPVKGQNIDALGVLLSTYPSNANSNTVVMGTRPTVRGSMQTDKRM